MKKCLLLSTQLLKSKACIIQISKRIVDKKEECPFLCLFQFKAGRGLPRYSLMKWCISMEMNGFLPYASLVFLVVNSIPTSTAFRHFLGGGVKTWSNLLADNSKKLPTGGGKGSKNIKICQRSKWMVP